MITILETKLRPPHARARAVERPRLLGRLNIGPEVRLVLVSAPPGFGKSTLVGQWIDQADAAGTPTAWLSLDPSDDEPTVFWTYLVSAIARVAPEAAAAALVAVEGGAAAPDQVIAALLNGLAAARTSLIVVLDDLHVIERRDIHESLAFLVDHLPAGVHLTILTRADPPLPLPRLRARGELVELRAVDLRFREDEAATYLNGRMGLTLDAPDVAALEARTEGWIAALQLAALSIDRDDPTAFIDAFAGDDRYVVDYLADEVLERQTPETRDFLLATSILDRMTGPLVDAVTGTDGGAATLAALDRANLFLVPLDGNRRWYRYHHLFRDLLRARLTATFPERLPELHRRAGDWWEAQGEPGTAIEHALAAGDHARAADLIEVAAHELRKARQEATLRRWLDALPDPLFADRPVLAMAHVGALLSTGEIARVVDRLDAAERWLPATTDPDARAAAEAAGMVVRHTAVLSHLPSAIALHRAALASMAGDRATTMAHARTALAAATEDQPLERGAAGGILGLALWAEGDLDLAYDTWAAAVLELERAGHRADTLGGFLAMSEIRMTQGRLADARRAVERGLAVGHGATPPLRGTADMHVALAEVLLARNELDAARAELATAAELGDGLGLPQHPWRTRVAMAELRDADGDPDAADELLADAHRVHVPDFFPQLRPIGSIRARLWARHGRDADALDWAREQGLTPDDTLQPLREHAHVTLATALVARARTHHGEGVQSALAFIDRLLAAAEAGGRGRTVIELLVLRAQAADVAGDRDAAHAARDRARALATPEGWHRLLRDADGAHADGAATSVQPVPPVRPSQQPLVEPLSERELDVLRLLASDLSGPEIAAQLFVSLSTLRTHTQHVYSKLGVGSRRAAVTRAIELGILAGR